MSVFMFTIGLLLEARVGKWTVVGQPKVSTSG